MVGVGCGGEDQRDLVAKRDGSNDSAWCRRSFRAAGPFNGENDAVRAVVAEAWLPIQPVAGSRRAFWMVLSRVLPKVPSRRGALANNSARPM